MKKIELGLLVFACISSANTLANDNLFKPKDSSVSGDELNLIVQEKLNEQQFKMENDFYRKIENFEQKIKNNQTEQLNNILVTLEELKKENEELKKKTSKSNVNIPAPVYSEDDVNHELSYLLEDNIDDDSFILTDDIIRLNNEFGEKSLTFVGIIDEHKIYKNKEGEYIVKGLDFDYSKFRAEMEAEERRLEAEKNANSKPPRTRSK
jgi:hypothetical protein